MPQHCTRLSNSTATALAFVALLAISTVRNLSFLERSDTFGSIPSYAATTSHPHVLDEVISPLQSNQQSSRSIRQSRYSFLTREIAKKWNLTSPRALFLLEEQFYITNDYNPNDDFLHFHHIHKTGGTSISDVINATLGALVDGHRGILPGSHASGRLNFDLLNGILKSNRTEEFPYLASYAHTRLRPIHGPKKTPLATFFDEIGSPKRLRLLAMLREPMDLRASAQAMAMCGLNRRVIALNSIRQKRGMEPICTPEQGLNISELWDGVVDMAWGKCPNGEILSDGESKLDQYEDKICKFGRSALDYCRSPTHLLSSKKYQLEMQSMLRLVMGRYTAQEVMYSEKKIPGFSLEEVEEYTLIDLGGLDSNIMHTPYNGYNSSEGHLSSSNSSEPDFIWFGITERMRESTCLLYYTLNVKPLKETPRKRVMNCPTTSWWTEEHREELKQRESADYAVWRAANAILDIRMKKMHEDVRQKLENEEDLTQKERGQYTALAEAGCLE